MNLALLCTEIAIKAHNGQLRKTLNVPYIFHPLRVARQAERFGLGENGVCAALLHDVVEDTKWTLDDLIFNDVPLHIVQRVKLLTKWWPDSEEQQAKAAFKPIYYKAIMEDPSALALKLIDRTDNIADMVTMLSLPGCTRSDKKWARNYLKKTKVEFYPLVLACLDTQVTAAFGAGMHEFRLAVDEFLEEIK